MALAVAGGDRLKDRRAAFATFKASTGEDGEQCCVICNSRLLNEGIDVAAVDAICFADSKSSVIDIVQAVGRALRQSYRQGKVSWVVIPVYLPTPQVGDDTVAADPAEVHDAGEVVKAEADAEVEASSFRTIWRVLRALAAHDARVAGRITELRAHRSQGAAHTTAAKASEGEAGEGEQQSAVVESPVEWLKINARQHAARILQTVKLRAFNPRAVEWQRMHAVAAVFHLQHGHLAVPATAKLDDYAVGAWMRRQRKADNLNPGQVAKLDALDGLWRLEPDWNRSYRRLRAYLAAGGTLAGPVNRTGGEADPAFRPGAWLRKQDKVRTEGKLTEQQSALLDALHRHAETVTG
ncbi:helicase associated domain-containing protein [Kitasatospora kifunensis]|uniref:Helicase n=1 Tax=Kitasatospora kifunensis TaxID=58351 RepID=A0A7W7R9V1_KITKI|nr:helicase associated domain-containing protein [Kitasatospora kifunensis]MBB4928105.1 hypothetical protein [Kitasatospora kifunensis]MBB4928318.1 hypothetical protein [Kitasatospora kifunensis]